MLRPVLIRLVAAVAEQGEPLGRSVVEVCEGGPDDVVAVFVSQDYDLLTPNDASSSSLTYDFSIDPFLHPLSPAPAPFFGLLRHPLSLPTSYSFTTTENENVWSFFLVGA